MKVGKMFMDRNLRLEYSEQWEESAEFFNRNKDYEWMAKKVESYDVILEIGCGTGYSTLSLLKKRRKVVVVENNEFCIEKTKQLLNIKGYTYGGAEDDFSKVDVILLKEDICEDGLGNRLLKYGIKAIVCWNIGSYWSKEMLQKYTLPMLKYGLTVSQIKENVASSYSELIQWQTCRLAADLNANVHLIDRNKFSITRNNDNYYVLLKDEFNFENINYDNKSTFSKSGGGRTLIDSGELRNEDIINITLVSVEYC